MLGIEVSQIPQIVGIVIWLVFLEGLLKPPIMPSSSR